MRTFSFSETSRMVPELAWVSIGGGLVSYNGLLPAVKTHNSATYFDKRTRLEGNPLRHNSRGANI